MELDLQNNYPSIIYREKEYYQIACRKCKEPNEFSFYSDGENFILVCKCNHISEIKIKNLNNRPDNKNNQGNKMV